MYLSKVAQGYNVNVPAFISTDSRAQACVTLKVRPVDKMLDGSLS